MNPNNALALKWEEEEAGGEEGREVGLQRVWGRHQVPGPNPSNHCKLQWAREINCFETSPWIKWAILIPANYKISCLDSVVACFLLFFSLFLVFFALFSSQRKRKREWNPIQFHPTCAWRLLRQCDQLIIRIWGRAQDRRRFIILIPLKQPSSMEQSHGAVCQPDERISLLITNMIKRNNTYNEGFWEIYLKKRKKNGGGNILCDFVWIYRGWCGI